MSFWNAFPKDRLLADVSVWSADLTRLADDMGRVDPYVDMYHIDVSDAHFTPGLLFFPDLVSAMRRVTKKVFHVHLMVERPWTLIDTFAEAGADMISIHAGDGQRPRECLEQIRERRCAAGLALSLEEDPGSITPFLDVIDVVIMLGTALGIKGQSLSSDACPRIEKMKKLLADTPRFNDIKVAADGGIREDTVPRLRSAGADAVVMGSLAFKSQDVQRTFGWIHSL